ncbi:MAG: VOC family protein [Bacillota bacterium]|nr:VOC family protein [Bacillota bacterium]
MKFAFLTIYVRDLEASIRFYESMAGLTVQRRFASGPAELAFLANTAGDTEIELLQFPGRTFEGRGMFICFYCDELDAMHTRATAEGLRPSPIQEPDDTMRYFYVYDPNGVSVQLRTPPAGE